MDMIRKRKLKDVIRGLIGDGFAGTQKDLVRTLKGRGFSLTQSTVSRVLNEMGVLKEILGGNTVYRLSVTGTPPLRGSLSDLIVDISWNASLVIVKTRAGSAMFVAGFIDQECTAHVLGTVAGDDTIFVAPRKSEPLAHVASFIKKKMNAH